MLSCRRSGVWIQQESVVLILIAARAGDSGSEMSGLLRFVCCAPLLVAFSRLGDGGEWLRVERQFRLDSQLSIRSCLLKSEICSQLIEACREFLNFEVPSIPSVSRHLPGGRAVTSGRNRNALQICDLPLWTSVPARGEAADQKGREAWNCRMIASEIAFIHNT
jgi:hypothetical protein